MRFDRERLWHEFLRAGFSAQDLKSVVAYLQKEIRASRRNVGALKLSNLLQLDRFEEDLNISKVRLRHFKRIRAFQRDYQSKGIADAESDCILDVVVRSRTRYRGRARFEASEIIG